MIFWEPFFIGFLTIFLMMHAVWYFAYRDSRNDYADIAWGPGFPLGAWAALLWTVFAQNRASIDLRTWIACGLVTLWAVRLFFHVGLRNLKKKTEDARYAKWRKEWGDKEVSLSYLKVFVLQACMLFLIDLPLFWIIASPEQVLGVWAYAGMAVWIIGFLFETIGDAQLKEFSSHPENKGKLINQGLWKWSRHPNYFGEVVQWWGIFFLAVTLPGGLWTVISPLLITYFILEVTGVPMLEEQMKSRPGYAEYQRKTSVFFPWPQRKD